ncbi:hypothetical protein WME79_11675 [Sorangium sp. So ce726]|uniref:hypothetical protein n=1 Tax=Sorangium sp. So ce726 TaxID=3133319 RepID=UPI003F5D84C1
MHNLDRTTLEQEGYEFEANEQEGYEFEANEQEGYEFEANEQEGYEFEANEQEGYEFEANEQEGHEFEANEQEGHEFEANEQEGHEFEANEQEGHEFEGQELEGEGEQEGYGFEQEMAAESPIHENEAMELAAELLTASNEQELSHLFGNIIRSVWGAPSRGKHVGETTKRRRSASGPTRRFAASRVGRSLIGLLRLIARQAIPRFRVAVGKAVAPGAGRRIGPRRAWSAGKLLGLELEGLSAEDREFEVAKQLVNLTGAAALTAAQSPTCGAPSAVARQALLQAAKVYAPGIVPALARSVSVPSPVPAGPRPADVVSGGRPRVRHPQGRWFRRGNAIVLVGA